MDRPNEEWTDDEVGNADTAVKSNESKPSNVSKGTAVKFSDALNIESDDDTTERLRSNNESRPDPEGPLRDEIEEVEAPTKNSTAGEAEFVIKPDPSEKAANPTISQFKDHFTLPVPSSVVRYRNSKGAARVIEGSDFQFVLEEKYNEENKTNEVTIRRIHDSSHGLRLLRVSYSLVAAFWSLFLFALAMQILLFLFLNLAIELGKTDSSKKPKGLNVIGTLLGFVPLIDGLAAAMVIAGSFVMDTWRGHLLVREFTLPWVNGVVIEWLYFAFFLGVPLFVLCCTLLARTADFWEISGLFWISSIAVFYCIFAFNVIFYEVKACFQVMTNIYPDDDDSFFEVVKRSILLRQTAVYGGFMQRTYLSRRVIEDTEDTEISSSDEVIQSTVRQRKTLSAHITLPLVKYGLFLPYEEPRRLFSVDDARDVRPFVTSHTWSLEKVFCRPPNSRYIAIVGGAGALTKAQMKSSLVCSFIGSFLVFFIVLSFLIFIQAPPLATWFVVVVAAILSIPNFLNTYRLVKISRDVLFYQPEPTASATRDRDLADITFSQRERSSFIHVPNDSEGLYLVDERYRLTYPSTRVAWILFFLEVLFFFIWPTVALFVGGNWPLALLYIAIVGVTGIRYYLNAAIVMEEVGHMNLLGGKSERDIWRNQSRLNTILGDITRGRMKQFWFWTISVFGFIFLALSAGAIVTSPNGTTSEDPTFTYLPGYEYVPLDDSMRYPSCTIRSDLQNSPLLTMADYIFLARVAYRGNSTQRELESWFGKNYGVSHADTVDELRANSSIRSQVSFKIITFPLNGTSSSSGAEFAYLAIRGTTNQWEALTDAQLWSPAMFMQVARALLPFGQIWTPVMPYLIDSITAIQSTSIDQISFYKDTVLIANWLKKNFGGVAVVGHSLGGGLSMITGAITNVPGIALSGPNTMLTRMSLEPKIPKEALDRYTFNIIPARDVVPRFDDPAQNYQNIRCNSEFTDLIGCHDTTRALCEAIYTCGSGGRPALCECLDFGFPAPLAIDPKNNISFAQACIRAKSANLTVSETTPVNRTKAANQTNTTKRG